MDQLRIGIIGVSGRGVLAEHWHKPQGRSVVVAGADVSDARLQEFSARVSSEAFTTTDYRELLAREDVDAVAITSPDFTHEEYAVAAFQAGKHVFCEKPMAITVDGCDRMLLEWRKSGKQFMVGFNMRYMNIFRAMKDIADSGALGEIRVVWVRHFVGLGGPYYFHDWHASRKYSTGLLLQKASHDIDMIHWITGHYGSRVAALGGLDYFGGDEPNDLECPNCPRNEDCMDRQLSQYLDANRMKQCAFRQEVDVEDNSMLIMELDNGIKASYMQCHFTPDYFRNYTFIGTEGRMENLDDSSKVIVKTRNGSHKWKNLADRHYDVKPAEGGHGGADPLICRDFVEMILDGKKSVTTPVAGRMSVAVGYAATESLRSGGVVQEVRSLPDHLSDLG